MVFTLNKLKLRYQPDDETDLAYDAFIKTSKGDALLDIISFATEDSTSTSTLQQLKNVSVKQEIRYNKRFSYEHTSTVTANYSYSIQENDYDWLFNQLVFNNLIPFELMCKKCLSDK